MFRSVVYAVDGHVIVTPDKVDVIAPRATAPWSQTHRGLDDADRVPSQVQRSLPLHRVRQAREDHPQGQRSSGVLHGCPGRGPGLRCMDLCGGCSRSLAGQHPHTQRYGPVVASVNAGPKLSNRPWQRSTPHGRAQRQHFSGLAAGVGRLSQPSSLGKQGSDPGLLEFERLQRVCGRDVTTIGRAR